MSNFEASKLPADASMASEEPAKDTLANGTVPGAQPTKSADRLSVAYKIEKAKEHKEKGNNFFKSGEFKKASSIYNFD